MLIEDFMTNTLSATVRLAIPILIAALGENISQRSGVLNLGLDGTMLVGAYGGFMTTLVTGNLLLGLIAGILIGGVVGFLMAFMSITLRTSQVINGIMIGILCYGLVTFLVGGNTWVTSPYIFESISIPFLSQIPVLGPVLFQNNIIFYVALALVPLSSFVLFRTSFGLKIRAVGENPSAADAVGVNVYHVRYLAVIFGAMMAGLGGAYFNLAYVPIFTDKGLAGRGWIALAVVIFGGWKPYWILAGALLFSFVDALQIRLQFSLGIVIPFQFFVMLPYILTIVALIIKSKRVNAPAALTIPYERE